MTKLTPEPSVTLAPAVGFELITMPGATVELAAVVTVPTTRPAPVIADAAEACVCPTTFGTTGPVETTRLTAEPRLTLVPAAGFSLITLPAETVELDPVVTVPTTKPAAEIAEVAEACVCPTTFGTTVPAETSRLTAEPGATAVPAAGISLITLPAGTVELGAVVAVPSTKPAPVIAEVADACVCPTTFGTATSPVVFRSIDTPPPAFATAKSGLPSPLKSPTATESGFAPVA